MIRFAWLQFRMQAAIAAGALAIVAVVLAVTGPSLVHLYDTTVAACGSQHACSDATTTFTDTDGPLQVFLDFLVLLGPLLIGMFWGAPLVSREFETGTFRLAWTQGVSRSRWLAVKLGLGPGRLRRIRLHAGGRRRAVLPAHAASHADRARRLRRRPGDRDPLDTPIPLFPEPQKPAHHCGLPPEL